MSNAMYYPYKLAVPSSGGRSGVVRLSGLKQGGVGLAMTAVGRSPLARLAWGDVVARTLKAPKWPTHLSQLTVDLASPACL